MDKEKEIEAEEMAKAMCLGCTQNECTPDFGCVVYNPARRAVKAGYGNVKQAVKEFAEELDEKVKDLHGDGWDEYNEGFKHGVQEAMKTMYELLKERFGE